MLIISVQIFLFSRDRFAHKQIFFFSFCLIIVIVFFHSLPLPHYSNGFCVVHSQGEGTHTCGFPHASFFSIKTKLILPSCLPNNITKKKKKKEPALLKCRNRPFPISSVLIRRLIYYYCYFIPLSFFISLIKLLFFFFLPFFFSFAVNPRIFIPRGAVAVILNVWFAFSFFLSFLWYRQNLPNSSVPDLQQIYDLYTGLGSYQYFCFQKKNKNHEE
eukprot:TRINITY_DN13422_c0_g1_i1.p1 TRINITY_DN13422_c0_g1~~TRINITY_DN13422_c0_g1_i1.p1  ORF type:complete len:216 (+),score=-17.43 TRINITY_DN13422_c0_g1_i1:99-746(+)